MPEFDRDLQIAIEVGYLAEKGYPRSLIRQLLVDWWGGDRFAAFGSLAQLQAAAGSESAGFQALATLAFLLCRTSIKVEELSAIFASVTDGLTPAEVAEVQSWPEWAAAAEAVRQLESAPQVTWDEPTDTTPETLPADFFNKQ